MPMLGALPPTPPPRRGLPRLTDCSLREDLLRPLRFSSWLCHPFANWKRCMGSNLLLKKRKKCGFLPHRNCLAVYVTKVTPTFACKDTEKLGNRNYVRRFSGIERQARRKLVMLAAAGTLDTGVPPFWQASPKGIYQAARKYRHQLCDCFTVYFKTFNHHRMARPTSRYQKRVDHLTPRLRSGWPVCTEL